MTPREADALDLLDARAAHIAALRVAAPAVVPCPSCGGEGEREDASGRWTCRTCCGVGEVCGVVVAKVRAA